MGVPTLGCHCSVCESKDPHDLRTRPSILLSYGGRNVVIDTTPDFRFQAMRAGIDRLDAVIYTHGHADHILGLDDIRPFNLKQRARSSDLRLGGHAGDSAARTFAYIFDDAPTESTFPESTCTRSKGRSIFSGCDFDAGPGDARKTAGSRISLRKVGLPDRFQLVPDKL